MEENKQAQHDTCTAVVPVRKGTNGTNEPWHTIPYQNVTQENQELIHGVRTAENMRSVYTPPVHYDRA